MIDVRSRGQQKGPVACGGPHETRPGYGGQGKYTRPSAVKSAGKSFPLGEVGGVRRRIAVMNT